MAFWATRYSAAQTQISHTHILLIKARLNLYFEVRHGVCVFNAHITFWVESLMHLHNATSPCNMLTHTFNEIWNMYKCLGVFFVFFKFNFSFCCFSRMHQCTTLQIMQSCMQENKNINWKHFFLPEILLAKWVFCCVSSRWLLAICN